MARPAAVALVAFVVITACGGEARTPPADLGARPAPVAPGPTTSAPDVDSSTTTVTSQPSMPGTTATTADATTPTTLAGPLTILEAGPGVPLLLSGLVPLSGSSARRGAAQADALQLAVETFGDIAGHGIGVATLHDTHCSIDGGRAASRAVVAAGAVIGGSPVVGVIGPGCDATAIEAVPMLIDHGFALVSPSLGEDDFMVDESGDAGPLWARGLFTLATADHAESVTAARFLVRERGSRRPVVVRIEGDEHGEVAARVFGDALSWSGVRAAADVAVSRTAPGPGLAMLVDVSPDALFLAIGGSDAGAVLEALAEMEELEDVDRIVLGDALLTDVAELEAAEGVYFVMADDRAGGQDVTGTTYADIRADYERRFGREPTSEAIRAYDATMLLLSAVARVAEDRDGTLVIDRRRIVDALFDADQPGFSGRLVCGRHGNCLQVRVRVLEHTGDLPGTLGNEVWIDD
ncbi:MAG TPA: ABC transporter substrate-binding protein [Acidimicrobiia bacterium]|nr:ABC transporter substrate-binding protein [Acidimicrobiia bacterium]